jgi:hypothetical protein
MNSNYFRSSSKSRKNRTRRDSYGPSVASALYRQSSTVFKPPNGPKAIRQMLNSEHKHIELLLGVTSVTPGTMLIESLTAPAEGTDSNQRTGRSVKVTNVEGIIEFKLTGSTSATAAPIVYFVRYFIVKWNAQSTGGTGTPPLASDFLITDSDSNYTTLSLRNPDNNEDFTVLATELVRLSFEGSNVQSGTAPTCTSLVNFESHHSFHQSFNSTTAASISENSIWMFVVAKDAVGALSLECSLRTWYVDN